MKVLMILAVGMLSFATIERPAQAQDIEVRVEESGWLGIRLAPEGDSSRGRTVSSVAAGTPAEGAGIIAGDRIVLWNGRPDVGAAIEAADLAPGDAVDIRIARGDEVERDLRLVAVERSRLVERTVENGREVLVIRPDNISRRVVRLEVDGLEQHFDTIQDRIRVLLRDSLAPRLEEAMKELEQARVEIRLNSRELGSQSVQMERAREVIEEARRTISRDFDAGLGLALAGARNGIAGAQFSDVSPELGSYFGTTSGVLVLQVAPGTLADDAGLEAGDVIIEAAGRTVEDVQDLREAMGGPLTERARNRTSPSSAPVSLVVLRRQSRVNLSIGD